MTEFAKRHWLFLLPLVVFAGWYSLQNIVGYATQPADIVTEFVFISVIFVSTYVVTYYAMPVGYLSHIPLLDGRYLGSVALFLLAIYGAVIIVACFTANKTPLFAAFSGATASDLVELRNSFLRTRQGWGSALNYVYAIFGNSLMPFVVAYAVWAKARWRHMSIAVFVLGLSLTLAKAAVASAAIPLIALFLMMRKWVSAGVTMMALVAVVASFYYLASGRFGADFDVTPRADVSSVSNGETAFPTDVQGGEAAKENEPRVENASAVPERYNITGRNDQLSLALNRIIWIPYITALDWLRYGKDVLHGHLVMGRSIKPFAYLTGQPYLHLERYVAALQWGGVSDSTSNSFFIADAMLNFGLLGVIFYSAFLAATIKAITYSGFPPIIAAASVPVWTICFNALPPVYFSGGLGFLLVIAMLFRLGSSQHSLNRASELIDDRTGVPTQLKR